MWVGGGLVVGWVGLSAWEGGWVGERLQCTHNARPAQPGRTCIALCAVLPAVSTTALAVPLTEWKNRPSPLPLPLLSAARRGQGQNEGVCA